MLSRCFKRISKSKKIGVKQSARTGFQPFKPMTELLEDRIQPTSSITTVAAQYAPVASGVADLLTATISVPAGTPTGMVAFSEVSGGVTTPLGTSTVSQVSPGTFMATLSATFTTLGAHDLSAVYSGDSNFATSTGTTTVNDGTTNVNFSNLSLASNSFQNGVDGSGGFNSGGASFNNLYDPTFGDWSGFSYTNVNYTDTALYPNYPKDPDFEYQYGAYPGTAPAGSGTYAVAFVSDPAFGGVLPTITIPSAMQVESAMFTNSTDAALSMLNGDQFAKKFGPNDWFLLTITGENASGDVVGKVPFYLAQNGSIVTNWQSVDLSSLSTATTLSFSETSSDTGMFGMNTPAFFAMDDLTMAPTVTAASSPANPVTSGTPVTITATVAGSPSVGTVTFYAGPNLTNPIGAPVNVVNGTAASSAVATLPVGNDMITVVYSGGPGFAASQSTESVVVNPPSTVYAASDNFGLTSPTFGQTVADADETTPGNQPAVYGATAFGSITAALGAISTSGTVLVNAGTYAETPTAIGTETVRLLGNAIVNSLVSLAGATVDVQGNILTTGSDTIAGSLDLNLDSAFAYGRITSSGTVNINGASLNLNATLGSIHDNDPFTIVTASSVTGTFDGASTVTVGTRTFRITYNPTSVVLTALPGTATTLVSAVLNGGIAYVNSPEASHQHSLVESVVYSFSGDVSLSAANFTLSGYQGTPASQVPNVVVSGSGSVWTVTFRGVGVNNATHSIGDGEYRLVMKGVAGLANSTFEFFRLLGDMDGNGSVSASDFTTLVSTFLRATNDPAYLGADDLDGDGSIGTADFAEFTSNFLKSLPTPLPN
jgi:hypothetical protein